MPTPSTPGSHIATLTFNPAIDISTHIARLAPDRKLRCAPPTREAGGGGVNVSRALHRLGGTSTLLYLSGGPTGAMLTQLLQDEGLHPQPLPIGGLTRENLIVWEDETQRQFRFGMPGPAVAADEWGRALTALRALQPAPAYLVASGSVPPGMPDEVYRQVAEVARDIGARLIVDTSGAALRHLAGAGTYLLKPNAVELEALAGRALHGDDEQLDAARQLIVDRTCEVVVLSRGADGALLVTREDVRPIRTPTVPIRSTVGAGDSMVAGIVLGLSRGMALHDAVRFGAAAGAAAVMTEGTELCRREDVERLYEAGT